MNAQGCWEWGGAACFHATAPSQQLTESPCAENATSVTRLPWSAHHLISINSCCRARQLDWACLVHNFAIRAPFPWLSRDDTSAGGSEP